MSTTPPPPLGASASTVPPVSGAPGTPLSTPAGGVVPVAAQPRQPSTAAGATATDKTNKMDLTDQAVLEYLQKKGLGNAVLELTNRLKQEEEEQRQDNNDRKGDSGGKGKTAAASPPSSTQQQSVQKRLEEEDAISRTQRSLLSKSTGGHFGFDRDSAWPVVSWGFPDARSNNSDTVGVDEARAYLDSFVTLQLWVLSLPDDDEYCDAGGTTASLENPVLRAQALLRSDPNVSLSKVMEQFIGSSKSASNQQQQQQQQQYQQQTSKSESTTVEYDLPPSCKNELLSVTFALLVHTYCELLEVGMESTAHMLRDAFRPLYLAVYGEPYRDLYQCTTTEEMTRLNSHNGQHMEALATLKTILVQVASYQLRREDLKAQTTVNGGMPLDAQQQHAKDQKMAEYDRLITSLREKYTELSRKATATFAKMQDFPFLRRARAVRWQLTLSHTTYTMLCNFLNARDDSLLAMSTLLQSKCELHVERRPPVPFVPAACVFAENPKEESAMAKLTLNSLEIHWASPTPRLKEVYKHEKLPFPKYSLEEEYENESEAKRDKCAVEFNRALLMHGFRRLEALERKREYDVLSPQAQKRLKEGDENSSVRLMANALEPSILLTTLCANTQGPFVKAKPTGVASASSASRQSYTDVSTIWEEAGVGLCCAKLCEPDGRRVAVGCDDSAVRIWSAMDSKSGSSEPLQVLLGHKNGFPVFDVDWNRDGRALLSCGGDGSVRLWDTMMTGPFGVTATPNSAPHSSQPTVGKTNEDAMVPELSPEAGTYTSGAALAVYRGHAPSIPVWSVSFSPSGYYFASAGGDATARLWVTDRPAPVRLFTGHTSTNVNCVEWHPNCNYVLTGSDDRTARLWDIQSGRTVRLLTRCTGGVNAVRIDPTGRHAAVADYSGTVSLWDLGSGRKVTEFRARKPSESRSATASAKTTALGSSVVHALRFSACGTALATGGDDCCVRIWDVQRESLAEKPLVTAPTKFFATNQTVIMDLYYTKRNLLLSIGKYVTPTLLAPTAVA